MHSKEDLAMTIPHAAHFWKLNTCMDLLLFPIVASHQDLYDSVEYYVRGVKNIGGQCQVLWSITQC